MPFQHTNTELDVLACNDAKDTALINIRMRRVDMGGTIGTPETAEERYRKFKADCVADAEAIYKLLNRHLPEETRAHLMYLYRIEGT